MKKIILIIILLISVKSYAQKATFNENTVIYQGITYKIGSVVHLGYGSGTNKDFAFINYGTSVGGINVPGLYKKAKINWSKADVEIEKIEKKSGVVWLRCKSMNKTTSIGSILGGKIYIILEGAVDNKEIIGVADADETRNIPAQSQHSKTETSNLPPAPQNKNVDIQPKSQKQINNIPSKNNNNKIANIPPKNQIQQNKPVTMPNNFSNGSTNGKLYFRTFFWTGAYGNSLEMTWFFLGNNGIIVRNPKHGVNPIQYSAEATDNTDNVGKYKIAGNKLFITWQNSEKNEWSVEYDHGDLSGIDGGVVSRPNAMPANYKLSGQYAASSVLSNVSAVQTFVFSKDGTFTLNRLGTVHTNDVGAKSESDAHGTYNITGNTLNLNFANAGKQVAVIWIWDEGSGKKHLVINTNSFPQE